MLEEGRALREHGLKPTLFCGGGWYTDVEVAEACAELGYVDCTLRANRPPYLSGWRALGDRSRHRPTSSSRRDGRSARFRRRTRWETSPAPWLAASCRRVVHVYFHDTDLLDRRRRTLLSVVLRLLARRAHVSDLDTLSAQLLPDAPRVTWDDVARL